MKLFTSSAAGNVAKNRVIFATFNCVLIGPCILGGVFIKLGYDTIPGLKL